MPRLPVLAALLALAAPALAADPGAEAARAYALETAGTTGTVKAGQPGTLAVTIKPTAPGWHVHPQAPLKIVFEGPPALRIERPQLSRRDAAASGDAPRFETPFVAAAPGTYEAKANVDFFICSDQACVKQTRSVALPVTVR